MGAPTPEATCRDCGYRFRYFPRFYVERGLALPVRCQRCRDHRRQSIGPRVTGVVERYDPAWRGGFGIIYCDTGERVVVAYHQVQPDALPWMVPGTRVDLQVEPGAPLRRATDVWLATEGGC